MVGQILAVWVSVGLGVVGVILGGVAVWLQRRSEDLLRDARNDLGAAKESVERAEGRLRQSEKLSFLEARRDLFRIFETLKDEGAAKIEWVTWESTIHAARANVAQRSVDSRQRTRFMENVRKLVTGTLAIVEVMTERGYRQVNHILMCCEYLRWWQEAEETPGDDIIEEFEQLLGERKEGERFRTYIDDRLKTMQTIKDADRYDEPFNKSYFLEALEDVRG